MKTRWNCIKCGKCGIVEHRDDIDVIGAIDLIRNDHSKESTDCKWNMHAIRVNIRSE